MISFRYIPPNSKVYVITDATKRKAVTAYESFFTRPMYTEPYYSKDQNEQRNAVVGFVEQDICMAKVKHIKHEDLTHVDVHQVDLWELKEHAHTLVMPLIVYVTYTELYYYAAHKKKTSFDSPP